MNLDSLAFAAVSTDGIEPCVIRDANQLNSLPNRQDQGFLVIAPAPAALQRVTPADVSGLDDSSITIFPLGEPSELADDWEELPPPIAVRCSPPESSALIAIPIPAVFDDTSGEPSFRDVSRPIWDWMIRQVDHGRPIRVADSRDASFQSHVSQKPPRLVPLRDRASRDWLRGALEKPQLVESPQSTADVVALRAGLLQIHDFLDESHHQSQSIEGAGCHAAGDYWHGIMHRREPDYGNSKYWFRRVGPHPLFEELAAWAENILDQYNARDVGEWRKRLARPTGWDPFAFIDLCETCAHDDDRSLGIAAREIQWQEMRLLLRHTYRDAVGARP